MDNEENNKEIGSQPTDKKKHIQIKSMKKIAQPMTKSID